MKRITEQLTAFAAAHRNAVLTVLFLLGLLAGLSLINIEFTNDVSLMFPDSPDAGTTFRILNDTKLGNTVQLEFIVPGSIEKHEKYLDATAKKLSLVPEISNVVFRYRRPDMFQELTALTALIPRFSPPEILNICDPRAAAKKAMKQLAFPVPGGVKMLRNQPFGLERDILAELRLLDQLTAMRLAPDLPYFATGDKHRGMIVFNVDIKIGDADSVRKLIETIRRITAPLPPGMQCRIISGIMHTLGNEEVLKHDAALSCTVSLFLFLLIFLFCYRRDWRAFWIPAVPLYASLLSLGIMTLFFNEVCLYVIGLGSCITGLAVDQGIHVYAAYHGPDAERRTAALTEPMMLSAMTSILVFIFLAFTGISAYIQLAVFAGLSLAFSCIIALIALPLLLDRDHGMTELKPALSKWRISPVLPLLLLPVAFFCGKILLVRSDFTLESLDGTPEEIRSQEADFNSAWRKPGIRTGVLAASGQDGEEALTRLLSFIDKAKLKYSGIEIAVPPIPPQSRQKANRLKWRTWETTGKIEHLEWLTGRSCKKHGLPEPFFQPFFTQLKNAVKSEDLTLPPMFDAIAKKMIREQSGTASAIALVEDNERTAGLIRQKLKEYGDCHCALLSKEGFKQMVREDLGGRFLWILPLSILAALVLAYAVFRNIGDVLFAMVPVYVSFCGLFLLGALTGFKATPAAAFAMILLTGLAIDYGIYAVSQLRHPDKISVQSSVFLSAATTVAGAGALVFSKHPALFGTGVVLSIGITLACLSGLFLVPMLKKSKTSSVLSAILFLFLLTGCASGIPFEEFPDAESLRRRMQLYPGNRFKIQANAGIEMQDRTFSFILTADLDPAAGKIRAAGISGAGTLIFHLDSENIRLGPGIPEQTRKNLEALRHDLAAIFFSGKRKPLYAENADDFITVKTEGGYRWKLYADHLIREPVNPFRSWTCEYRNGGKEILYSNRQWGYTIRLKTVKIQTK